MSAFPAADPLAPDASRSRTSPRRIAIVRAVLALVWAAALVIAVGDEVPSTSSDVPIAAAFLLASYPAIDVVASIAGALGTNASARALRVNAAIGVLAVVAIGVTAFGAWAAVSGAIQFAVAVHLRRTEGRQLPMLISGGLSTIAGLAFVASSGMEDAHLAGVGGYMALGALLFLLSAHRSQTAPQAAR